MGKNKDRDEQSSCGQKTKRLVKDNLLIILMITALIIGVALGLGLRSHWKPYDKRKIHFLKFPGDLLMNMLKMLILPLVVSSLISSLANLEAKSSRKMVIRAFVYCLTTTFSAVVLGIILALSIQPGYKGEKNIDKFGTAKDSNPIDALMDLMRNCFPNNLVATCFEKQVTKIDKYEVIPPNTAIYATTTITTNTITVMMNATAQMTNTSREMMNTTRQMMNTTREMMNTTRQMMNTTREMMNTTTEMMSATTETRPSIFFVDDPNVTTRPGINVLGLVVFSICLGSVISKMGNQGKPLADFFEALHTASMKLVTLVIWYSPVGIIFLIASKLVAMDHPEVVFERLAYYMATVLAGLAIHAFIILPLVYFVATRKNPFIFMYNMLKALLTAWGTASSSATLPVTMECLEHYNGVDIRIIKFVAPIAATTNLNGTALYEAVASIFIAQHIGKELNIEEIVIISLTSTAAAISSAGVPQAGLVTIAIVLTAVGLPIDNITLILAIDWFLERFRTAVNVLGSSYGTGIVEHLSKSDLAELDAAKLLEVDIHFETTKEENGVLNPVFDST